MQYDVHFSVAGFIIYILLLFIVLILYNKKQNTVKKLLDLISVLALADFFDVISAYTIDHATSVPLWLNYLLTTAFFIFQTMCMAMFPRYVRFIADPEKGKRSRADKINIGVIIVYIILLASSPFTHFIFYFDNYVYTKGNLYNISYIFGFYFMFYTFFKLIQNHQKYTKRQAASVVAFIVLVLGGSVLQFSLPGNVLVLYFSFSIATVITVFGLETPDSFKLEKALLELEKSQKELQKAVDRAEAADRAKSDFLANMSHEIRTPINAILGMNELISRESTQEIIQGYSADLADAGHSLLSLINDILDFSKIEAGKMELSVAEYNFAHLLHEINSIIEIRCAEKGLSFAIENNENMPNILLGDDVRIRQVLINILNNALKYTDQGKVTLNVDFKEMGNDEIEIIIAVKDTGIGIKEENLPALFESFKRIDLEHNRKREGTGLGLNITKSLVEMMDILM